MNSKRQVNWVILFNLLKGKRPFGIMGIVFTCLSLFVFFPLLIILSIVLKSPYDKYDFDKIRSIGTKETANIISIRSVNNVTINDEHPKIISYDYDMNGKTFSDKFETLDIDKIQNLNVGSTIEVLAYQDQSIINGLEPFTFPVQLFLILPGMFLMFGIVFLLIGLIPSLKTFNLYKTGVVKKAHIVSIIANIAGMGMRALRPTFSVNYYFLDEFGNKVFGESSTGDVLFLNDKKEGDVINVFVSEQDENKSCLIPALEAMKYNWSI